MTFNPTSFDDEMAGLHKEPPEDEKSIDDLYHELLLAVCRKFPGEDRHATALRYIREAEARAMMGEAVKEAS